MLTPAGLVQGAGEQFLAHPGFTGQQHRGLGRRHALQQLAGGDEAGGDTYQLLAVGWHVELGDTGVDCRGISAAAEKVARVQISQVDIDVFPLLCRFADDAACRMAHGPALQLAKHHQAPEQ
ncbi:hypothetical protein D3C84_885440 [compost metagenome]